VHAAVNSIIPLQLRIFDSAVYSFVVPANFPAHISHIIHFFWLSTPVNTALPAYDGQSARMLMMGTAPAWAEIAVMRDSGLWLPDLPGVYAGNFKVYLQTGRCTVSYKIAWLPV